MDWKKANGDRELSEQKTRHWLQQNHATPELADNVCEAIRTVSYKGPTTQTTPVSLEGKIVQDVDRLDSMGAIGIVRAISFGASKNRKLYDPNVKPKLDLSEKEFTERTLQPRDDTTINHLYEKSLLLKDRLHTQTAKRLAEHRHAFMEQFLDEFLAEWEQKK